MDEVRGGRWLSLDEAAQLLRVTRSSVNRAACAGDLPVRRRAGGLQVDRLALMEEFASVEGRR